MTEIANNLREALASLNRLLVKANGLPLPELASELRDTLKTLDTTLHSADQLLQHTDQALTPELGKAIADTRQAMQAAQGLLAGDSPTQQELRRSLREISRAAESLHDLTDLLQRRAAPLLGSTPSPPAKDDPATARP